MGATDVPPAAKAAQVRLHRVTPSHCRVVLDNPPLNLMGPEFDTWAIANTKRGPSSPLRSSCPDLPLMARRPAHAQNPRSLPSRAMVFVVRLDRARVLLTDLDVRGASSAPLSLR